ncbi:MAG: T9SS type A sorting domain-containing protein [Bacteroidota bacterium]|nr:T9SS type A sorting domain-containing protein [Bacteroidota bacterium]
MKKIFTAVLVVICFLSYRSQNWVEKMQQPNSNFYDIQQDFNMYWADKDISVPGNGYKAYKRWEYFVEPRVYPSGNLGLLKLSAQNFQSYIESNQINSFKQVGSASQIASTTWTATGPLGAMTGSANNGLPRKAGRDNFITFHPSTLNTFWVGSPAGGLWKTTDNGVTWTILNGNLAHIGCTDLVVDPTNPNIMYLATGDGYAGDTPSLGIYKSTDGGTTWVATGLTYAVSSNGSIRKLIINPTNTQILLAATSGGVYRTINGGTNWTQVATFNAYDLDFKPGDPTTVYATGTSFYLSTNSGASFTAISSGISTTGVIRKNLAVTAADPNYVYVVSASNSGFGLEGVYRSINSGTSFSLMANSPDLLANSCAGTAGSGQGWYDLAIAVSPTNKNEVVIGGVNHWRSTNGGTSWTCIGCWNSVTSSPPYIHADVHDLDYRSDGVLYSTNDGGVYYHTGTTWPDITANRNIAQIYRIGLSSLTANRWITGHQDNGSNLYIGSAYQAKLAGDGMDCQIDRTNDNYLIASNPSGSHAYSSNGGTSWSYSTFSPSQNGAWVTPIKQDPSVAARYYSGRTQLYVSNNSAVSFSALPATGGSGSIIEFAIAPSNNQIIYVLHSGSIRKTVNGGTTWTNVTGTVPVGTAAPTYICIKPSDPNTAWVTLSGYSAANKIFKTTDGGVTWTNVTSNLPNLPNNCIVYEPGTNDRIYVGMDVGVYYRDNLSTTWTLYNTGLPNTPISELEISPAAVGKLRAATYGRGVYEVDVVPSAVAPVSSFSVSGSICSGVIKTFNDISTNAPNSWSWSVTPSAGVTITTNTLQNPQFIFTTPGTYSVSMQANNGFGSGSISNQTVNVIATPSISVTSSVQTICASSNATISASGATTYSWSNSATTSVIVVSPAVPTVYTVTGYNGTCVSSIKTATVNVNPSPTLTVNSNLQSICSGSSATITASGATTYSWSNTSTAASINVNPTITTVYFVNGAVGSCSANLSATVNVNPNPILSLSASNMTICNGQTTSLTASGANTYTWLPLNSIGTSVSDSPSSTQTYTCNATDLNGCVGSNIITIQVLICTGISNFANVGSVIKIYPNPASDRITVNYSSTKSTDATIKLFDVNGKVILNQSIQFSKDKKEYPISLSLLESGIYFVEISGKEIVKEKIKIIKQ